MRNYLVYKITCVVNGKYYIGYTRDFVARWKEHCYTAKTGANLHFSCAIRLYGKEAFSHEFLSENLSKSEAVNLERLWIITLGAYDPKVGYNMTFGGDGNVIVALSPEYKKRIYEKISKRLRGRKYPPGKYKGTGRGKNGYKKGDIPLVAGKTHIEFYGEEKAKQIAEKLRLANLGSKKGFWVTNGIHNKVVKNDSLIPDGWWRGRKDRKHVIKNLPSREVVERRTAAIKRAHELKRLKKQSLPVPVSGGSRNNEIKEDNNTCPCFSSVSNNVAELKLDLIDSNAEMPTRRNQYMDRERLNDQAPQLVM